MKISNNLECDILIVGGGIAGLISAKKASDSGKKVILVINDKLGSGASYFELKGTLGIQATAGEKDKELYYEDVISVGKNMTNSDLIKTYIDEIEESIPYLNEIGFEPWLRNDNRPACFAKYLRKIYLIKDWQKSKMKAKEIFKKISNLTILENTELVHLVKKEERVVGGVVENNGKFISISTPVVIMATGGIAGLYKNKLYPNNVYGNGHIILLDIGAKAQNMEFIQFIPAFLKPVYNTLFGEHTLKYCIGMYDIKNNLILNGIEDKKLANLWEERSEYAPFSFDFASHKIDLKIFKELEKNGSGVKLKFSELLYKDKGEFYTIFLEWLKNKMGIDMVKDEIIITHFAHSCNGGIKINKDGETGVKGVYAIGELSSGVEGANRLGGNSMGASLVFGKRAVDSALKYLSENKISNEKEFIEKDFELWIEGISKTKIENPLSYEEIKNTISEIISKTGNICRDKNSIIEALKEIDKLKKRFFIQAEISKGIEIYYRLEVSRMLLLAMLNREESRGAHYRKDFPFSSDKIYKIEITRENGEFVLNKK